LPDDAFDALDLSGDGFEACLRCLRVLEQIHVQQLHMPANQIERSSHLMSELGGGLSGGSETFERR
jgi:hypothetical protein